MPEDTPRRTERVLPVVIGHNYEHVMGRAQIFRKPNGEVMIQIDAKGTEGQILGEFLEQAEPIAVSFAAIPVQNLREKREKT